MISALSGGWAKSVNVGRTIGGPAGVFIISRGEQEKKKCQNIKSSKMFRLRAGVRGRKLGSQYPTGQFQPFQCLPSETRSFLLWCRSARVHDRVIIIKLICELFAFISLKYIHDWRKVCKWRQTDWATGAHPNYRRSPTLS
jgi:hypothetical protein